MPPSVEANSTAPRRDPSRGHAKLAQQVALRIRRDVVARGWPVGEVLGAEPELVERYGVSRAVLREAVRIVEYLGVARMRQGPGGGLVVTAPDSTAVTMSASVYLAYAQVGLEEVLAARRVVEALSATLAAERAAPGDLAALAERVAARPGGRGGTRPAEPPWRFHDEVAALTGNPAIELFVTILSRITGQYATGGRRSEAQRRRERQATAVAHAELLEALSARDPGRARRAMDDHLDEIGRALLSRRGRRELSIGDPDRDFPGTKLGSLVALHVFVEVVEQGWPVGELIGSEAALMRRHQVSRAVIREAIRLLEFHQVVRTRRGPGGGVFVTEPDLEAIAEAMAVHLEFSRIDRQQLFEVRSALELETVTLAAERLDAAAVAELRRGLEDERLAVAQGGDPPFRHSLHATLAKVTGNRALWLFLQVLIRLTEERGPDPDEQVADAVHRAHSVVVDAIEAGDAAAAQRRMRRHLDAMATLLQPSAPPGVGAR